MIRCLLLFVTLLASGCSTTVAPWRAVHVASAATSRLLCSAAFITGQDPDQAWREEVRPEAGMGLIAWLLDYRIDRQQQLVVTTVGGGFESRASYRDGQGCLVERGPAPRVAPLPAVTPRPLAGPEPLPAATPQLQAALAAAFAEPADGAALHTKAVVVLHRGRLVGERYAAGVGVATRLHGHSVSKSVTNTVFGLLQQQGRLDVSAPAGVAAWQNDARAAITTEQLLRATSGLPAEGTGGFGDAGRMWHIEHDMAAFAALAQPDAAPGTRWAYSEGGYMLLSRRLRDLAGGDAPAFNRFLHGALLEPLGLASMLVDVDGTGTPIAGSQFHATARDWARLGQFWLDDGVIDGRRLLPAGWMQRSTTASPGTGYGAGFWLNNPQPGGPWPGARWGLPGVPADAYFARGYLGQFIVVVPSRQLVVVRLAVTHRPGGDPANVGALVAAVIAALGP